MRETPQNLPRYIFPKTPTILLHHAQVLAGAVHAASEAGALMKANVGADVLKTKFNPKDLLTEVDGKCQKVIEKVVTRQFPDHALLGEESVEPGAAASTVALSDALEGEGVAEWLWIVDPIDGTTNFVHGIPLSAVSIGVAYRGQVVVGENMSNLGYIITVLRCCVAQQYAVAAATSVFSLLLGDADDSIFSPRTHKTGPSTTTGRQAFWAALQASPQTRRSPLSAPPPPSQTTRLPGCIYDPFRDELFTATRGGGAFLNGMKVQVGDQATIGEATVACGAPPGVLALGPCVRGLAALAPHVRTTRMLGSAGE